MVLASSPDSFGYLALTADSKLSRLWTGSSPGSGLGGVEEAGVNDEVLGLTDLDE